MPLAPQGNALSIAAITGLFLAIFVAIYFGFFYRWPQPVSAPSPSETSTATPVATPDTTGELETTPRDYSFETAAGNMTGKFYGNSEKFNFECAYPGNWHATLTHISQTHTTSVMAPNASNGTVDFTNTYFIDPQTNRFIKYTPADLERAKEQYRSSFQQYTEENISIAGQSATRLTEIGVLQEGRVKSIAVFLSPDSTVLFEFFLYDPLRVETFSRILDTCRFTTRVQ